MAQPPCSALIRATLFVEDQARSATFYGALGLTETYYQGLLEDASASVLLGFDRHWPYPVRIVKTAGPCFGMVGLFQLDPRHDAETLPTPAGPARRGEVALIFYTPHLEATVARLKATGATWIGPVHVFHAPQGHAQPEICLRDPDGVLVNLVQRDPADQKLLAEPLSAWR